MRAFLFISLATAVACQDTETEIVSDDVCCLVELSYDCSAVLLVRIPVEPNVPDVLQEGVML